MSSAGAGGFRLSYDEGQLIGFKEYVNELRVMGVVLQQQNPERSIHGSLSMLPGGGSLMTPQKMPSSLTALTNS